MIATEVNMLTYREITNRYTVHLYHNIVLDQFKLAVPRE